MNKLTIYMNDQNQIKLKSQNPMDLEDLIQITQTALLGFSKTLLSQVPPDHEEAVKGYIYDQLNQAFTKTLEVFAPEYELHPNLTAQAILEAENALIEKAYKEKMEGK